MPSWSRVRHVWCYRRGVWSFPIHPFFSSAHRSQAHRSCEQYFAQSIPTESSYCRGCHWFSRGFEELRSIDTTQCHARPSLRRATIKLSSHSGFCRPDEPVDLGMPHHIIIRGPILATNIDKLASHVRPRHAQACLGRGLPISKLPLIADKHGLLEPLF